jgi:hypothetical protein
MAEKSFTNIKIDPNNVEKSVQWYQAQVRKLGQLGGQTIMNQKEFLVNRIMPGKMYLFFYDPKFKNILPYYDRFPLILPFRKVQKGFFALNLHYLPYGTRFKLLGYLFEYLNNDNMDETSRLNITWKILIRSTKLEPVKACVKHYLNDHVESRFFEVPINNWLTAALLPVERFEGANKQTVWNDSRKKY